MNLGDAVFRKVSGHSPRRAETPKQMFERALSEAGGVSQLARSLGVARTTVQRWQKGATPTQESQELLRSVLRRADMSSRRAARLSIDDRLVIKGKQGGRARTVNLSPYLAPGTMGRAVEAYLNGARPRDLHVIVWSGITDQSYRWVFQPPGGVAQMTPADRVRAIHRASGGGEAAGGGGGSGGSGASTGGARGHSEDLEDDDEDDGDDDLGGEEDGEWYDAEYDYDYDLAPDDGYEFV